MSSKDSLALAAAKRTRKIARAQYDVWYASLASDKNDADTMIANFKMPKSLQSAIRAADAAYLELNAEDAAMYRRWAFATDSETADGFGIKPALRIVR